MRLRTCPLCRSKAVSAVERIDDDEGGVQVRVCCGQCSTWRSGELGARAADALERRLRRDRERMALTLGQADRWREIELGRLSRSAPQGAGRKAPG